ncbi:hypothetical protein ACFVZT_33165 [Streptomyces sp. NPDC058321]
MQLEVLGFRGRDRAAGLVADGNIEIGDLLPVNVTSQQVSEM